MGNPHITPKTTALGWGSAISQPPHHNPSKLLILNDK